MNKIFRLLSLGVLLTASQMTLGATPLAPSEISAANESSSAPAIRVRWRGANDVAGTLMYALFRSDSDSLHFALIATTTFDEYKDFQIAGSTVYYYYVKSVAFHDTTRDESPASPITAVTSSAPVDDGHHGGSRQGTIQGQVTDSVTGGPLQNVVVSIYRVSSPGVLLQRIITGGGGKFQANVDTGSYFLSAQPQVFAGASGVLYLDRWYKDAADAQHAVAVVIASASTVSANFALVRKPPAVAAFIRGTVRDSSGAAVKGARVAIMRSVQAMEKESSLNDDKPENEQEKMEVDGIGHGGGVVWKGMTDSLGKYEAALFAGDSYTALAAKEGFSPQYFDHQANPLNAAVIVLRADTAGVDFQLLPLQPSARYTLRGTVEDSSGMKVMSRVILFPLRHEANRDALVFGFTDSLGAFTVKNARAGKYFLLAVPFSKFAPAYFKRGMFGVSKWQMADTVNISSDTSGFDIGVARFSVAGFTRLSGKVRSKGSPERGSNVFAVSDDGSITGYGLSDGQGDYEIEGLSSGHHSVSADLESFDSPSASVTIPAGSASVAGIDLVLVSSVATAVTAEPAVPSEFRLSQNFPNPFNPSTRIAYALPAASTVTLKIFNVLGQEVAALAEGEAAAGVHDAVWNGRDNAGATVASGAYFYKMTATPLSGGATYTSIKRMMLLK